MKTITTAIAAGLTLLAWTSNSHAAADQSSMMATCNTYAAKKLKLTPSDIADVKYEGQRTDGTHAVNGTTTAGQTFQCSFNKKGTKVVKWFKGPAPKGCPVDVSEANRYLYPDCN